MIYLGKVGIFEVESKNSGGLEGTTNIRKERR